MKRLLSSSFIILVFMLSCVETSEEKARQSGKDIYFEEEIHDYGEIAENSNGTYKFRFKNIADTPVIVNRVRSSCGCTIPTWPRNPVEPGSQGEIVVRYNTELTGSFQKSIYVYSTASNSPVKLQIKGKVIPQKNIPDAKNLK